MRVCVHGLWHLGAVTAGCLARGGHQVVGLDSDDARIEGFNAGKPPLHEPGLEALLREGLDSGRLSFSTDPAAALRSADVVWITHDTPVDEDDRADVESVVAQVRALFPHLPERCLVLVSSQLPVGTTRRLERAFAASGSGGSVTFGYSPENLRLGKAIEVFTQPERVVVGVRSEGDRQRVAQLLAPFTESIEWMSVESAEMTKHALNAFLATSISFTNEVATLCEKVGADAKEVERGLRSEPRIGQRAYVSPGGAFSGGTLARDVEFLVSLAKETGQAACLLEGVQASNVDHADWARRKLATLVGDLAGKVVAVWGLTYKPGTDTLRRSASVALCRWLAERGARVQAHDPAVRALPEGLEETVTLCADPLSAARGAVALVVATQWPEYRDVPLREISAAMAEPRILDANRFLSVAAEAGVDYVAVGVPERRPPGR